MWCTGMCFRKSIKNCFGAHSRTEEEESKSPKLAFTIERKSFWELWQFTLHSSSDVYWPTQEAKKVTKVKLPSISSTINKQIFRTNVVFSSYVWLGAKNLYKKCAWKMLMKLTSCYMFFPGTEVWRSKFYSPNSSKIFIFFIFANAWKIYNPQSWIWVETVKYCFK